MNRRDKAYREGYKFGYKAAPWIVLASFAGTFLFAFLFLGPLLVGH